MPLIGETIGAHFDKAAARWRERDGAGRAPAGHPLELCASCSARVDALRRRPAGARARAGRPRRHLVAEQRRMGGDAVRHRQGRPDPGQHQPGLPPGRAGIRAEQGRLQGAGHRRRASRPATMSACCASWRRSSTAAAPGKLRAAAPAGAAASSSASATTSTRGCLRFDDVLGARRRRRARAALAELAGDAAVRRRRSTSSSPAAPPARPRARRSPTTTSSTTASSSARRCGCTEHDRLCIPVPLYHCFGMVLGNLACLTHGAAMVYPGEGFDPLATLRDGRRRSAAPRSTACRPCSSPSSTIPTSSDFDLSLAAHRHHGRLALPDRGDEARASTRCT